jgi:hypothetical protein
MTKKRILITLIVFLGFMILTLNNKSYALKIDGYSIYFKDDVTWNNETHKITISGIGKCLCMNHHYWLNNGISTKSQYSDKSISSLTVLGLKNKENRTYKNDIKAAVIYFGETYDDYGFKEEQYAYWRALGQYSENEGKALYNKAKKFVEFINNGGSNLKFTDSEYNVSIKDNNYIIGDFKFNFTNKGSRSFASIDSVNVTSNGKKVSNVKFLDTNGKEISVSKLKNRKFYIKIPYDENLEELTITVTVKEITGITTEYEYYDGHKITLKLQNGEYVKSSVSENAQNLCHVTSTNATYGTNRIEETINLKQDTEMEIAGTVWEDNTQGKDQKVDGKYTKGNDNLYANMEVRLYKVTKDTTTTSNYILATYDNGCFTSKSTSTNPTLTDSNGRYSFKGVNPTNDYVVVFTYDGISYTNTYGAGVAEYNSDAWKLTSKGSETVSERNRFNNKFYSIGSDTLGYKTSAIFDNSDNYLKEKDGNLYNTISSGYGVDETGQLELALRLDGSDIQSEVQQYKEKITEKLSNVLKSNKILTNEDYIEKIYEDIINDIIDKNDKTRAKQILQYIYDCKINSYAGYESVENGIPYTIYTGNTKLKNYQDIKKDGCYPYYDNFLLTDKSGIKLTATTESASKKIARGNYYYIYEGQLYINLGLIRRDTTDLSLYEDVTQAVVSINEKDETYKYGLISKKEVNILSSDTQYNQNITTEDYSYANQQTLSSQATYPENYAPLHVYITYKIEITNQSETSMPTKIDEVVSYFDRNYYSYSNEYTTTAGNKIKGITATYTDNSNPENSGEKDVKVYTDTIYGTNSVGTGNLSTKTNMTDLTDMYIRFADNILLEGQDKVTINITYSLGYNSDDDNKFSCTYGNGDNSASKILQDKLSNGGTVEPQVITEINGYSTYTNKKYDGNVTCTNYAKHYTRINNENYRKIVALDANSIPGNISDSQLEKATSGKVEENDWDRAAMIIFQDPNAENPPSSGGNRTITGNVWETNNSADTYYKSETPTYNNDNNGTIEGLTVQLIELKTNKETGEVEEYIRAQTNTNSDGSYTFTGYIPGDYVVRFVYGDKYIESSNGTFTLDKGVKVTDASGNTSYEDKTFNYVYNGQFYQSAKSNPNTNNEKYWYNTNTDTRYSDAYDEANIRYAVNELLNNDDEYTYYNVSKIVGESVTTNGNLVEGYIVNAYTSKIEVEVECATTETSASNQNPGYTINNIDFALTKRTESNVEVKKEVTHIKLTLSNQNEPLIDASVEDIRAGNVPATKQSGAEDADIEIDLSSEALIGAQLDITYKITVTNNSEYDSVRYFKDSNGNLLTLELYEEDDEIPVSSVYYEDGKIRIYNKNDNDYTVDDGNNVISMNKEYTAISVIANNVAKFKLGTTELKECSGQATTTIPTTARVMQIADYIPGNLSLSNGAAVNQQWSLIDTYTEDDGTNQRDEFIKTYYQGYNDNYEISSEDATTAGYIAVANSQNNLINAEISSGGDSRSTEIVLSASLTGDIELDTQNYENTVRLVQLHNTVSKVQELNSAKVKYTSGKVIIKDPDGGTTINYLPILIGLIAIAIISGGIVLIKKFVLIDNKLTKKKE